MHRTLTKLHGLNGMSLNMLKLLVALNEVGSMNMFGLHAETGISETTMTGLRARAVTHSFIQRTASSDRRQCVYELTKDMKELMA